MKMTLVDSMTDLFHVKRRAVKIMLPKLFHAHGLFCASHPWEVIVFTLTLTLSVLSMGSTINSKRFCVWNKNCAVNDFNKNADVVIMTLTRCMAVLYSYHQFRNLRTLGSKYILGIAGLFTVFSSFVFSSSVINFLQGDFTELNEALPFFFLLIDLSKASLLAQFALTSSSQQEVRHNIARGMALLGPTITLDTIVETLVIGVGTLSGMKRLEAMCCFACLSVVVNYLVFMTFFPACLSLVLELSRDCDDSHPVWQLKTFTRALQEEEHKPNPVLQRVKLIMSAGLLLVHAHSRWPVLNVIQTTMDNDTENVNESYIDEDSTLGRWLSVSTDQIIMVILALALAIKYIFFESRDSDIISPHRDTSSFLSQDTSSTSSSQTVIGQSSLISKQRTKITQTELIGTINQNQDVEIENPPSEPRSNDECLKLLKNNEAPLLTDDEVISLVNSGSLATYQLEKTLQDAERAVSIRRKILAVQLKKPVSMHKLPYEWYDYSNVTGVCCENVIGYTPVPVGVAGPLLVNGTTYHVPMATTEGCLVASTNRGCRALMSSGGVTCTLLSDGMTRGPVVRLPTARRAGELMRWLEDKDNFDIVKESFNSTSRFGRLQSVQCRIAGRLLFIRFKAFTGDAMGMNMVSKATEKALETVKMYWKDMEIVSLSGNFCTDKKSTALNWIEGRGKSVVCEAIVKASVVEKVLKTSVGALVDLNLDKNLIGSAVAGSVGGFNAQAANIVTAIFIATGQDPAQSITSSNCMTLMEPIGENGEDLYISCTMPSIEVGTVGGGTLLPAQAVCLQMLGVRGSCNEKPGANACMLALIVAATVLAGELSLMSALSAGHLVDSHMKHNRAQKTDGNQSVSSTN